MDDFLAYIGLLGTLIFIILLIVSLIRKKFKSIWITGILISILCISFSEIIHLHKVLNPLKEELIHKTILYEQASEELNVLKEMSSNDQALYDGAKRAFREIGIYDPLEFRIVEESTTKNITLVTTYKGTNFEISCKGSKGEW